MKGCNRCKVEKPEDQFGKNKNNPDGLDHYCKECRRAYKLEHKEQDRAYKAKYREAHYIPHPRQKQTEEDKKRKAHEYYLQHKDYIKAESKAYRATNRDKCLAYSRTYYATNHDKCLELSKNWHSNNKDRARENRKAWRDINRDSYRKIRKAAKHKRKAIIKGNGGSYTKAELDECLSYFDNRCAYTGEPLVEGYHMDHVMPLTKGGTSYIRNMVPSNPMPNIDKSDQYLDTWYLKQPYYSKERHERIKAWIA